MNLKKILSIFLLVSLQITPLWSQDADESAGPKSGIQLMITRASEASTISEVQNGWFSALSEAYYYFRFQPLESPKTVSRSKYAKALPVSDNFGVEVSEQDVFGAAAKVGATHVLIHTYSIEKEQNTASYYLELFTVKNKKVVMVFDKSFPLQEIDKNLDECSRIMFEKLVIKPSGNAADAFKRAILASDPKALEEFGSVLIEMSDKPDEKMAKK